MKIICIEPYKKPYVKEIASGLKSLQSEVNGYIEVLYPFDDDVAIVCNENGKFDGLDLNRALRFADGDIYDIIAGTFLVVGLTEEDFGSLSDELINKYMKLYSTPEMFINYGGKIISIPYEEI